MIDEDLGDTEELLRNLGMTVDTFVADSVLIEKENEIISLKDVSVTQVESHGQQMFQLTSQPSVDAESDEYGQRQVEVVSEYIGCDEKEAEEALQETGGDIALAIDVLAGHRR